MALLEVNDLRTTFSTDDGPVRAVDGVSFDIERGQVIGIVGESGSGKSVTMLSIMRLLSERHSKTTGEAIFDGQDLLKLPQREMRTVRGANMAMIFQDPMTSLNPVYKVGWQLAEAIRVHDGSVSKAAARVRGAEMLAAVGIPSPRERLDAYPHELSGGMRQRVMIAMALVNNPKLLIADEPTTALDVTTQAQILQLLRRLREDFNSAIIFITHDLGVVAELCDEVLVMYAGRVVEHATVDDLFSNPQHPYTWGLLGSLPSRHLRAERLYSIPGAPPSLLRPPAGCRFHPRCEHAMDICKEDPPPELEQGPFDSHAHACLLDPELRATRAKTFARVEV
jgi:oligopeptide/dipeptide ABC transporter ATP-binding protein